jgi:hypothetical protein
MRFIIIPAAAAVLAASSAYAQQGLNARIPFEFSAGDAKLPAGDYKIRSVKSTVGAAAMKITGNGKSVMVRRCRLYPR